MSKTLLIKAISVIAIALFLGGCSYTKLTSSWFDMDAPPKHYKKIGVVALAPEKSNRGAIENSLVSALKANGMNAGNTLGVFPKANDPEAIQNMDEDAMEAAIREKVNVRGIDALMIVALLDTKEEHFYVEGESETYTTPYYAGYGRPYGYPLDNYATNRFGFYGYYSTYSSTIYSPGYYVDNTSYFLETSLFDVKSGDLVWSGQTTTIHPTSIKKEIGTYADLIAKQILHDNVLK